MQKYRKKPVVIDAIEINAGNLPKFRGLEGVIPIYFADMFAGLQIETLEGTMYGNKGDFLIRGVQGELYPCKKAIFLKTYEPVNA